ncbi:RICIN domain-containing protein [Agaribacter marinus]|uniref:Ricin B lectin domain-containing protein n=1 Tax=Agaribacter marinus TaxID=1431249 RepID=A0AA37SVI2_9ALTE|nr:hypothetical protein [Agaribacter marinus]GLR70122.1 hypothetical protein GCM10007852_10300 [Agaribacter marinus]
MRNFRTLSFIASSFLVAFSSVVNADSAIRAYNYNPNSLTQTEIQKCVTPLNTFSNVLLTPCAAPSSQLPQGNEWTFKSVSNNTYEISINVFHNTSPISVLSQCLDDHGGSDNVISWDCNGGGNQKWKIGTSVYQSPTSVPTPVTLITGNNWCLTRDLNNVFVKPCDDSASQAWIIPNI